MKNLYILTVMLCFCLTSCNSSQKDEIDEIQIGVQNPQIVCCGKENPQQNLPWLRDLIKKANSDETLNYLGTIWLEEYKGEYIFVTDMKMGSGGLYYHFFDCSGKDIASEIEDSFLEGLSTRLNVIIYSNISKILSNE